jgi:hypothetical protein
MVRERPKVPEVSLGSENAPLASNVGALLIDLRNALQQAERCRLALRDLGFSRERWQEIVKDVDPELRFVLRPQVLDAIVVYLQSAGKPVKRPTLIRGLNTQGAGTLQRIQQSITIHLRAGNLVLFPGKKIGLPAWMDMSSAKAKVSGGE